MRKRLFSGFLALIMMLSSLPATTVFADDTQSGGNSNSAVNFTKTLVPSQFGQRSKVKLEAWTTGSTVITESTIPTDIVLVLDQSGSMDDRIGNQTKLDIMKNAVTQFVGEVANLNVSNSTDSDFRVAVVGFASESGYSDNSEILTAWNPKPTTVVTYTPIDPGNMNRNQNYYIFTGQEYNKISYRENNWYYQVGWFDYQKVNVNNTTVYVRTETNATVPEYGVAYNDLTTSHYADALINCTTETISDGAIGQAIEKLDGNGATRADLGLIMANNIFENQAQTIKDAYASGNRAKVVVFLTDGVPTSASNFNSEVANNAVAAAKNMKDKKAHIFSMYLGSPSSDSRAFMQSVSSNYPNATQYTDSNTQNAAAASYYSAHGSSDAIQNVFKGIASTITTNTRLNETSVVKDVLTEHFHLPLSNDGTTYDLEQVQIYTVDKTSSGWANAEVPFPNATVSCSDGRNITITGFNFAAHCVTDTAKDGANDYGRKLVIYIPLVPTERTGAVGETFGGYLPTNADVGDKKAAGLYETADAAEPVKSAPTVFDDVRIRYEMENAERTFSTAEDTFNIEFDELLAIPGVDNKAVLEEMIHQLPDGVNNTGVNMVYTLAEVTDGNVENDKPVASISVPAGGNADALKNISNWTFFTGYSKDMDVTLTFDGESKMVEKIYRLTCTLTSTNANLSTDKVGTDYQTLTKSDLLEVVVTKLDTHAVHGVIDNGGTTIHAVGATGSLVGNTYTEAVVEPNKESSKITFKLKTGYQFDYIILRTEDVQTRALTKNEILQAVTQETAKYRIDVNDDSCIFQALNVTGDIAIEVYTKPIQFELVTEDDLGSNVENGRTYYYHADEFEEVFFEAHPGYQLTELWVGTNKANAHKYDLTDGSLKNNQNDNIELIYDGDTVVGGSVKVPMTQNNYVKVSSEKRSYTLTYEYCIKNSDGTYTEYFVEDGKRVEFGANLPAPQYKAHYGSEDGENYVIADHNYTLSEWFDTHAHAGMDFSGVVNVATATMPAKDLVLYAYWERNPDVTVKIKGITKTVQGTAPKDTTFTFHAEYHEHLLGEADVMITSGFTGKKEIELIATMTDRQWDGFCSGNGSIYIHEVPDNYQHDWIYDNTRYELKYVGNNTIALYKNGASSPVENTMVTVTNDGNGHIINAINTSDTGNAAIVFTNSIAKPDLSVEKTIVSVKGEPITYDENGNPTNTVNVGEKIIWKIKVTNNGNVATTFKLKDTLVDASAGNADIADLTVSPVPSANGDYSIRANGDVIEFTVEYTVQAQDAGKKLVNTVVVTDKDNHWDEGETPGIIVTPYKVTYTDGVEEETVFEDQVFDNLKYGASTPAFVGTPSREGYAFDGWTPEVDATVSGNKTYVAKWAKTYKVTYNYTGEVPDGAPAVPVDTTEYKEGATVTVADNPTLDGYTFGGWSRTGTFEMPAENVVITGSWTKNGPVAGDATSVTKNALYAYRGNERISLLTTKEQNNYVAKVGDVIAYQIAVVNDSETAKAIEVTDRLFANATVLNGRDVNAANLEAGIFDNFASINRVKGVYVADNGADLGVLDSWGALIEAFNKVMEAVNPEETSVSGEILRVDVPANVIGKIKNYAYPYYGSEFLEEKIATGTTWITYFYEVTEADINDATDGDAERLVNTVTAGTRTATEKVWTKDYKVTYRYYGDIPEGVTVPTDPDTYVKGEMVTVMDLPKAVNFYSFAGWYKGAEKVTEFEMPGHNVELTGVWTKTPTYTVKYEVSGDVPAGYEVPTDPNTYKVDDSVTVKPVPQKTDYPGYTFSGWKLNGIVTTDFTMPAGPVTLTGVWTIDTPDVTKTAYVNGKEYTQTSDPAKVDEVITYVVTIKNDANAEQVVSVTDEKFKDAFVYENINATDIWNMFKDGGLNLGALSGNAKDGYIWTVVVDLVDLLTGKGFNEVYVTGDTVEVTVPASETVTIIYNYKVTVADAKQEKVNNEVTVDNDNDPENGNEKEDEVEVAVEKPEVNQVKKVAVHKAEPGVGDKIQYTVVIENTYSEELNSIDVTDDMFRDAENIQVVEVKGLNHAGSKSVTADGNKITVDIPEQVTFTVGDLLDKANIDLSELDNINIEDILADLINIPGLEDANLGELGDLINADGLVTDLLMNTGIDIPGYTIITYTYEVTETDLADGEIRNDVFVTDKTDFVKIETGKALGNNGLEDLYKAAMPETFRNEGQLIQYMVVLENDGAAESVTITDTLMEKAGLYDDDDAHIDNVYITEVKGLIPGTPVAVDYDDYKDGEIEVTVPAEERIVDMPAVSTSMGNRFPEVVEGMLGVAATMTELDELLADAGIDLDKLKEQLSKAQDGIDVPGYIILTYTYEATDDDVDNKEIYNLATAKDTTDKEVYGDATVVYDEWDLPEKDGTNNGEFHTMYEEAIVNKVNDELKGNYGINDIVSIDVYAGGDKATGRPEIGDGFAEGAIEDIIGGMLNHYTLLTDETEYTKGRDHWYTANAFNVIEEDNVNKIVITVNDGKTVKTVEVKDDYLRVEDDIQNVPINNGIDLVGLREYVTKLGLTDLVTFIEDLELNKVTEIYLKFDVNFVVNGKEISNLAKIVEYGKTVADPEYRGIKTWYTDEKCTEVFDFDTEIERNTTLYAKYDEKGIFVEKTLVTDAPENGFEDDEKIEFKITVTNKSGADAYNLKVVENPGNGLDGIAFFYNGMRLIEEASEETSEGTDTETSEDTDTETSEGTDTETSEGTDTETSEGTDTETSEGTDAETSEGTDTETSEGTNAETSEGTDTETSEGTDTETSEGTDTETSESTDTETSEGTDTETSEGTDTETSEGADTETSEDPSVVEAVGEGTTPAAAEMPYLVDYNVVVIPYLANGESITFSYVAIVDVNVGSEAGDFWNKVMVKVDDSPVGEVTNKEVKVESDIDVDKEVYKNASPEPGEWVIFKITVKNTGYVTLYNINVTETPDRDDFVKGYFCDEKGVEKDYDITKLKSGEFVTLYYTAKVSSAVKDGDSLTNTVTVKAIDEYNKVVDDSDTNDDAEVDIPRGGGGNKKPSKPVEPSKPVGPSKVDEVLNTKDHFQYVQGYPEGTVGPERNITRAEATVIFFRLLQDHVRADLLTVENNFPDVNLKDWFNAGISTMESGGFVSGYDDGYFRPNGYITRAELATIISNFDDLEPVEGNKFPDVKGHWAEKYVNSAAAKGWLSGYDDGLFRPNQYITRAETMSMINRVLGRKVNAAGLHKDAKQWIDNTEDKWYYYAVLEATNHHDYERADENSYENWTAINKNKVWEN